MMAATQQLGNGAMVGVEANVASADERRELERYFPAVPKDAVFCVGCASFGHRVGLCPLRSCRICGGSFAGHMLFGCPRLSRAPGQLGVGSKSEPPDSGPASSSTCQICLHDISHSDICPMLWMTFVPETGAKRKASQIAVSCYVCGLSDHLGGDCKENTGEHISGRRFSRHGDIWCQKYASQFSDGVATGRPEAAPGGPGASKGALPAPNRERKRAKTSKGNKQQRSKEEHDGDTSSSKSKGKGKAAPNPPSAKKSSQPKAGQQGGGGGPKSRKSGGTKGKQQATQPAKQAQAMKTTLPTRAAPPKTPSTAGRRTPGPQPTSAPNAAKKAAVPPPKAAAPNADGKPQPRGRRRRGKGKGGGEGGATTGQE